MSIALSKGGSLNLTKKEPTLKKAMIGLGWDLKPGNPLDLDASVFLVGRNGKIPADEFFVFYNNLKSPDGSIQHTGDNRTGIGEGDDEMILANLSLIHPEITEIIIIVTIHDAETRKHHFGMLKDAYIRLVDVETKREVLQFDLDESSPEYVAFEFGRIQKLGDDWVFKATGVGSKQGLQGYVDMYA